MEATTSDTDLKRLYLTRENNQNLTFMKNIVNLIIASASLILCSSCITSNSYLAGSRLKERNNVYQLEQRQREEAARLEMFRIKANKALSTVVTELAAELYQKLGRSATPEHSFSTQNISYYYNDGQAVCPVTFYLRRQNKEVTVSGNLTYYNNAKQQVKFVCTDAVNTRMSDRKYIRSLSEGILFNTK